MIWSYSGGRAFKKCQRQWYFDSIVAHHNANHPLRQEAYKLSKLDSISAWRGKIVDAVISRRIVYSVNGNRYIGLEGALNFARKLFKEQLEFARANRYREPEMTPKIAGDAYAAFFDVEYGELCDAEINQAWQDIEVALTNLFQMDEVWGLMEAGRKLAAQRNLTFYINNTCVKAVPDLIIFNKGYQPTIVDWKVHTFATSDARKQLACYALALSRCDPHFDFPKIEFDPTEMSFLEVQLLTRQIREYNLVEDDLLETESYIASSIDAMKLAKGSLENGDLRPFNFDVTLSPETCERCPFQSICWDDSLWLE